MFYTSLSELDHKLQYVNVIGVINGITPIITKLKNLQSVDLEIADSTLLAPGFVVKLNMNRTVLNEFLNVAKSGIIIEILDLKVVKNEGVVYGEAVDQDDIKLFNDNATVVKWHPEEEITAVSGRISTAIKNLVQWKKSNIPETPELVLVKNVEKNKRLSRANTSHPSSPISDKSRKSLRSVSRTSNSSSLDSPKSQKLSPKKEINILGKQEGESKETISHSRLDNLKKTILSDEDTNRDTKYSTNSDSKTEKKSPATLKQENPSSHLQKNNRDVGNKYSEKEKANRTTEFLNKSATGNSFNKNNRNVKKTSLRAKKHEEESDSSAPETSLTKEGRPANRTLNSSPNRNSRITSLKDKKHKDESDSSSTETSLRKVGRSANKTLNISPNKNSRITSLKAKKHEDESESSSPETSLRKVGRPGKITLNSSPNRNARITSLKAKKHEDESDSSSLETPLRKVGRPGKITLNSSPNRNSRITSLKAKKHEDESDSSSLETPLRKVGRPGKITLNSSPNRNSRITSLKANKHEDESDSSSLETPLRKVGRSANRTLNSSPNRNTRITSLKTKKHEDESDSSSPETSLKKVGRSANRTLNSSPNKNARITSLKAKKHEDESDSSSPETSLKKVRRPSKRTLNSSPLTEKNKTLKKEYETLNNNQGRTSSVKKGSPQYSLRAFKPKPILNLSSLSSSTSSVKSLVKSTLLTSSDSSCSSTPENLSISSPKKRKTESVPCGIETNIKRKKLDKLVSDQSKQISEVKLTPKNWSGKKANKEKSDEKEVSLVELDNNQISSGKNVESNRASQRKNCDKIIDQSLSPEQVEEKNISVVKNGKKENKQYKEKNIDDKKPKSSQRQATVGLQKNRKSISDQESSSKTIHRDKVGNSPKSSLSFRELRGSKGGENKQAQNANSSENKAKQGPIKTIKCSKGNDYILSFLHLLTKKTHLREVQLFKDNSAYDLEEIDVPEKFDLDCKVVSTFLLIEDDVQVVRVQDGSICPTASLVVPESSSWKEVTDKIQENPVVKKNSPFVDIIILNSTRMDRPIVPTKMYNMRNIMATTLNLKNDPRTKIPKGEIFFFAEGQNVIPKLSRKQIKEEIEEKISKESYRKAWENVLSDISGKEKSSNDLQHSLRTVPCNKEKDSSNDVQKDKSKNVASPANRKRKLNDSKLDIKTPPKVSKKTKQSEEASSVDKQTINISDLGESTEESNAKLLCQINATTSSDETMLGETPALLKELREIMHEESVLGLPQTMSEDVHLKNTGSEVTFSQFCQGAEGKAINFRTSTENNNLSGDIVLLRHDKEDASPEESGKMEPLVYSPSGSSLSSAVNCSPLKNKELSRKSQDLEMSSKPVVWIKETKPVPKVKSKDGLTVLSDDKLKELKDGVICDSGSNSSLSVKILSSNSSEIEFEYIQCENKSSSGVEASERKMKSNKLISSSLSTSKLLDSSVGKPSQKTLFPGNTEATNDNLSARENKYHCNITVENVKKKSGDDQIEILSDNSSSASFFSVDINKIVHTQSSDVAAIKSKEPRVNENHTVNGTIDRHWYLDKEKLQRLVDKFVVKSTKKPPSITQDEVHSIYNEENNPIKFFTYSHNRSLPFVTLDIIRKLGNSNCLTTTVTLVSISPSVTDSWQENFIKSRCPSCNKLFDVYNASNNRFSDNSTLTSALSVGSHIVCPDSQCCNEILESPEFHFSVELRLKDGTPLTALIAAKHAEEFFGCTAQEAQRDEEKLEQVAEKLHHISRSISALQPLQVTFTREDICDPKSGPLYIKKIIFSPTCNQLEPSFI